MGRGHGTQRVIAEKGAGKTKEERTEVGKADGQRETPKKGAAGTDCLLISFFKTFSPRLHEVLRGGGTAPGC